MKKDKVCIWKSVLSGFSRVLKYTHMFPSAFWGGWVRQRCRESHVTGASNCNMIYRWARPAVLAAGKGREGFFFISSALSFIFLSPLFLSSPLLSLLSLFSLSLGDDTNSPTRVYLSLNSNTIKNPSSFGHLIPAQIHNFLVLLLSILYFIGSKFSTHLLP